MNLDCDTYIPTFDYNFVLVYTVVHAFNGHEVNGIRGLNGKKCYDKALYLVNN